MILILDWMTTNLLRKEKKKEKERLEVFDSFDDEDEESMVAKDKAFNKLKESNVNSISLLQLYKFNIKNI